MVMGIIIVIGAVVHHEYLINVIAINERITKAAPVVFSQYLPLIVVVKISCRRARRVIRDRFNPAAQGVIGKLSHRRIAGIFNFDNAVFVVIRVLIAVGVHGQIARCVVGAVVVVNRSIPIRQVINIINLIGPASQVDICAIAQVIHRKNLNFGQRAN